MRNFILPFAILFATSSLAQSDHADARMLQRIRDEALNHSSVMDIAFYLTDVNGPRLQGSAGYLKAANWAKGQLAAWGASGATLEPWGEWGRGWELQKSYLALSAPYYKPIMAMPKAWCAGTNGAKQAEVVMVDIKALAELENYRGKLKDKIVILAASDTLMPSFTADASRHSDDDLRRMNEFDPAAPSQQRASSTPGRGFNGTTNTAELREFLKSQGAVAMLTTTTRSHDGTLFVARGGSYATTAPENFLDMAIGMEDYYTILRLVKNNIPVKLDIEVKTAFNSSDTKGYNVIADIPGTDNSLKDELVIIGGHLDSWHGSTGATDNAAGCSVMLETIRILKAIGFKPRRTIRIALWGGEETGLIGSANYVRNHFVDTVARKLNAAGEKVSVYFNLDNGTGKIRGIYAQGNAAVRPLFARWFEPFADLGAGTVTLQNTGGTDHGSFDRYGLPAFQFIQDGIEYNSRTHHSTIDSYDHLLAADLKQAATIVATFVYRAAQRDEKIPRKLLCALCALP